MDRQNETLASVAEELGTASIETRGLGSGKRDIPEEQDPASGLTDD